MIVVAPVATLDANPCALIVAAAGLEEVQTTTPVMSCVEESLNVPVAANCLVVFIAMPEFAGVTAIETKLAAETVRVAVPLTEPEVAVMVTCPVPTPVAMPLTSMVAEAAEELHVTEVRSCVLPSSKLPTAVNCWLVPAAIVCTAGLTAIEVRFACTTVRVDVSLIPPTAAVMVVWPAATVVATPALVMVATDVEEDVQVTPEVKSALLPSLYVAVATYC